MVTVDYYLGCVLSTLIIDNCLVYNSIDECISCNLNHILYDNTTCPTRTHNYLCIPDN